jgi:hypothetical protein
MSLVTGVLDVELFLADCARSHVGPERAVDVLESEDPFLAVRLAGRVMLVARDAIRWVCIAADRFDDPSLLEGCCSEESVALTLRDGSELRGIVRFSAPSERARLVDVLNLPGQIITLFEGDTVYLVRRAHVATVAFVEAAG